MKDNFNTILNDAIKKVESNYADNKATNRIFENIYPFTTENISGYINKFNLKDKSLLTIGSSGDQAINAILNDCKDITIFDINPYTKYYYFLKMACILDLNIEEFFNFLRYRDYLKYYKDNNNVFNIETFNKIKSTLRVLDYESYLFWNELFQNYPLVQVRMGLFFYNEEFSTDVIIKCNPYLQSNILYDETKEKLKKAKITFINEDIFKLETNKSFDNIWLSNLAQYMTNEEVRILVDKVSKYLNDEGKLLICYLYVTTIKSEPKNDLAPIYNLSKTFKLLSEYNPELITFTGITNFSFNYDGMPNDSVLIYTKKRV